MIDSVSPTEAPSRVLRYLPGRVVVAWAVLGAAAAMVLMYSPVVYEERASNWRLWSPDRENTSSRAEFSSKGRVRVLRTVVYEEKAPLDLDDHEILAALRW